MTVKWATDGEAENRTTWPVDVHDDDEDSVQWKLRYGDCLEPIIYRMSAASVMSAYAALIDPSVSQATAIDKLKRARRVAAALLSPAFSGSPLPEKNQPPEEQ